MGINFLLFNRRENRRALAIFDRKEIAHLPAVNIARILRKQKKRFWDKFCNFVNFPDVSGFSMSGSYLLGFCPTCPKDPAVLKIL